ncbi:hypothetical protein KBD45_03105 [Candidatus Dojkabacteria bacterium]|nr:hypothetical protein [Candidatus Dojkabacteria bacterium]
MNEKNIHIGSSITEGVQKLDRSKLQRKIEISNEDGASSIKSIIMLVVIIVLVAITGAYVVKNLQPTTPATDDVKPTQTVTPTPIPTPIQVVMENIKNDTSDPYPVTNKVYGVDDTSLKGDSSMEYELSKFVTQPYNTFYRLEFDFTSAAVIIDDIIEDDTDVETVTTGSGAETDEVKKDDITYKGIPSTTINYRYRETGREQIEIVFTGITGNITTLLDVLGTESTFAIFNSSVKEISYTPIDNGEMTFIVSLNDYAKYNSQVVGNKLIIDIEESKERVSEPVATAIPSVDPSGTVTPVTSPVLSPSATPSKVPTNVPTTSASFTSNIESKNITASAKARISGYTFDDTSDEFIYQLKLAGTEVPKVSSRLTGDNKIEVKIEDLSYDGLTKDGKAFTDFTEKGVKDILTMDVAFGGTTSNYVYSLTEKKNFKVALEQVDGENRIVISISH